MPDTNSEGGPDPSDIRATLDRLLANAPFCKSPQLANFLRYVVEETLAGRGDRIKAYTIATAALGRDEAFDPQTDPIVRVEAGRLRRALRSYYADGGDGDVIKIELLPGSYIPVFSTNPQGLPVGDRLREIGHEWTSYLRENRQLVLLIFGIAFAVSVSVELFKELVIKRL